MRGFFISSALNPGKGPQLTIATAGDQLTLQTRVYNYSFAAMPSGSSVHVRFYVQPLDKDKNSVGNSILINNEDVVLSPISPFSDTSSNIYLYPILGQKYARNLNQVARTLKRVT